MSDVRLTALNPADSQVYPVACNDKGEILLDNPINPADYVSVTGDNMTGDLTLGTDKITLDATAGSAEFAGNVTGGGYFYTTGDGSYVVIDRTNTTNVAEALANFTSDRGSFSITADGGVTSTGNFNTDGGATFAGDVIIGSRNKKWMIVESNGLAHLVEQTMVTSQSGEQPPAKEYPELRDIPTELDLIEQALGDVMEKLRMNPPSGWPVWDGSDENR